MFSVVQLLLLSAALGIARLWRGDGGIISKKCTQYCERLVGRKVDQNTKNVH